MSIPEASRASGSSVRAVEGLAPGSILADRYRIVARLGRGGMGEVFRADDLTLGTSVALKFVPFELVSDTVRLDRLRAEVRLARQVSHPNVCRVFDIASAGDQHFISMEYIDGEDLASLLRRIGRLPKEKAVDIARQLCAGLAAAHEQGVIHRDLKPANIMLDGRGKARITDFGVAALVGQDLLTGPGAVAGTPAYMAPEQLAGREVTRKSDIYSLGLVLYELFTGKPAFSATTIADLRRLHSSATPPASPSSLIEDLDPAVESVILRCLRSEPNDRPTSAIAVAAALPGGDPLAAALAAGETPSPEMVAQSGQSPALRPRTAIMCLVATLIFLALLVLLTQYHAIYRYVDLEHPPEVLAAKARDMLKSMGSTSDPADFAFGFSTDTAYLDHIEKNDESPRRWERLRAPAPPAVRFWYRVAPARMVPTAIWMRIPTQDNPPATESGSATIITDTRGLLHQFEAMPAPRTGEAQAAEPSASPDWSALLALAGFDIGALTPTDPLWIHRVPSDVRIAWLGSYPGAPDVPLRIEAAAQRGHPVAFRIEAPWSWKGETSAQLATPQAKLAETVGVIVILSLFAGAALLAWRHLRSKRGDRAGAMRVALFCLILTWIGNTISPFRLGNVFNFDTFDIVLAGSLYFACLCWVFYIALEPFVRRVWPQMLISWTRVLRGRLRDPLVGRDILIGCLFAGAIGVVFTTARILPLWLGQPSPRPYSPLWELLDGGRQFTGWLLHHVGIVAGGPMLVTVLLIGLRALFRRNWPAYVAFILVMGGMGVLDNLSERLGLLEVSAHLVSVVALLALAVRCGLLAVTAGIFCGELLQGMPLTTDFSAWYAGLPLTCLAIVVALAVYGFFTAIAGQPLFASESGDPPRANLAP